MKTRRFADVKARLLADAKVRAHYDAMEQEFTLAAALIAARAGRAVAGATGALHGRKRR